MIANTPTPPALGPSPAQLNGFLELTPEEHREQLESAYWFHDQRTEGKLGEYEGKFVAILNRRVVDVDADEEELVRRIGDLGARTAVIQYIPALNDCIDW